MKRPTLADAAYALMAWRPILGLSILDDGTVSTGDVSKGSTITPGRSDKDQVNRWLYERYFNLCREWMDWAETELVKAEKWDKLKPETKVILEISTEYNYDDVMAGRLSPERIKTLLDEAFWEHGLQKGTWILEFHELKNRLEAIEKAFVNYFGEDVINYEDFEAADHDECDSYYFANATRKILEESRRFWRKVNE